MSAAALVPGRLYLVRCQGRAFAVLAAHACDAIIRCATAATLRKARP